MMKGKPVLVYARWQLLDYCIERSIPAVLVGLIVGLPFVIALRTVGMSGAENHPLLDTMMQSSLTALITQLAPIFTLLTINKIVAGDRSHGYYRFLFAKPISVQRYYAQLFVINGIGMAAVVVVLGLIAHAAKAPVPIGTLLMLFMMTYIMIGGLGFLCSVLVRFDWQAMVAVSFAAFYLYSKYGDAGGIGGMLLYLLPPVHLSNALASALLAGQSIEMGHIVWSLGYGAACFVMGVIALRYRPLAS